MISNPLRKFRITWLDSKPDSLFDSGFRVNGGGYLYGAAPYRYWRVYKLKITKYL